MKIRRVLSLAMACSMVFSQTVFADEQGKNSSYETETVSFADGQDDGSSCGTVDESMAYLESIEVDKQEPVQMNMDEINSLMSESNGVQPYGADTDAGELNNTIDAASPYNSVPYVKSKLTSKYDLYGLGMRTASLQSETDEDWYSVRLTAGETYFVDLRNVGLTDWFISLYYIRADGSGYFYTTNPEDMPVFSKKAEKYFYFDAEDTGTYYIRINNGGDWKNQMNYFFYVGPAIQEFDIEDMPTYGTALLFTDNTYVCDLREAVQKNTAIVNLSIKDSFISGTECNEVDKWMSAGGKTYRNTSGTGSPAINNITGASLGQLWTIGAKCARGGHNSKWSGKISGRFVCIMEPYPGNEVSF